MEDSPNLDHPPIENGPGGNPGAASHKECGPRSNMPGCGSVESTGHGGTIGGNVVAFPVAPVRAWVAFPTDGLWVAMLTGVADEPDDLDPPRPVAFDVLLDIFRQPGVRMGLPIIFPSCEAALGGAA